MIEDIINSAIEEGYLLECGSENRAIKTRRGEVKVYLHDNKRQPYCYPFMNEIHLNKNRENLVKDLMHEKGHFDILPYDFLLYGAISLTSLAVHSYGMYQNFNDWKIPIATVFMDAFLFSTMGVLGGFNLLSDTIIEIRDKLKLNRVKAINL